MEIVIALIIIGIVMAVISNLAHKAPRLICPYKQNPEPHKWTYQGEGEGKFMQCSRCKFIAGTDSDKGEEV